MGRARLAIAAIAASLAGLSASAGGLVLLASPAGAASTPPTQPSVTVNHPTENAVVSTSTTHVDGTVTPKDPANASITIEIDLKSTTNNPERTYFLTIQKPSSGQPQWPFSADVPAPDDNGSYQIIATATESDSGGTPFTGPPSSPRDVTEKVPPQPPTGVSAMRDANGANVSWQPNPEGDIKGYRVERASLNGSDWATVGTTSGPSTTSFHDPSISPRSDYQYRVWAERSDGQTGTIESTSPSASASTNAPPPSGLFRPGGTIKDLPAGVKANADPVAGLIQPGPRTANRPVTGAPTAGGYSNLPYGGQAALNEPGTSGAQDPKGHNANLVRTALFVVGALILFAIAAALIRMRRAVDNSLQPVDDSEWDEHWDDGAEMQEPAEPATVSAGRSGSDVTRAVAAQRENSERLQGVARAMSAYRRR